MSENKPRIVNLEELEQAVPRDQDAAVSDQFFQFVRTRTQALQTAGMPEGRARSTAMLEHRIEQWPLTWGSELHIIIYGDFQPPKADLHFSDLGIVVEAGAVKKSIVRSALCVVKARVTVSKKSIAGLVDASARINAFLGVLAALDWGDAGSGWWCQVTHGSLYGGSPEFEQDSLERALGALKNLEPDVRLKVISALYWIREPKQLTMEGYRSDVLRVYAGYWNAFECLVEAVCLLHPQPLLGRIEKQARIDQFLANHVGKLDPASISECYCSFVNPGFRARATHALTRCFPDRAQRYVDECFDVKPESDRLYKIRNAISHGDIDASNLEELIRVEDKQRRLWMIVFGMLGQIIPIPVPLDTDAK